MTYTNTFGGIGGLAIDAAHFDDQFSMIEAEFDLIEGAYTDRAAAAPAAVTALPAAASRATAFVGFKRSDGDVLVQLLTDNDHVKVVPETAAREWQPFIYVTGDGTAFSPAGQEHTMQWDQLALAGTDLNYSDFYTFDGSAITVVEEGLYLIILNAFLTGGTAAYFAVQKDTGAGYSEIFRSVVNWDDTSVNIMLFQQMDADDKIRIRKYLDTALDGVGTTDFFGMVKMA